MPGTWPGGKGFGPRQAILFGCPFDEIRTDVTWWRVRCIAMRNTLVVAVLGLLFLAGCSSSEPTSSPSGDVEEPTSQSSVASTSKVPTPDVGQKADYLAALEAIDSGLVANEDRAIRRGRAICDRILRGSDGGMSLDKYTVEELSGGNATINEAQAKQVIKAVKVWCKP